MRRSFRQTFVFDLNLAEDLSNARTELALQEAKAVLPTGDARPARMAGNPLQAARKRLRSLEERAKSASAVAVFKMPAAEDPQGEYFAELTWGRPQRDDESAEEYTADMVRKALRATFAEWRTLDDEPIPEDELNRDDFLALTEPGVLELVELAEQGMAILKAFRNIPDYPTSPQL